MRNYIQTQTNNDEVSETSFHGYTVEQVPLFAKGNQTRFLGNVRSDTGECLGTCTDRYDLVQNETLLGFTETLLKGRGLSRWERKEVVTHGGAKARFIYKFPDLAIKVAKNDLIFALKVQNSFDGSLRASFNIGLFRLICSNGMTVPHKAINLSHKHTGTLNSELMSQGLDRAIAEFQNSAPVFERMSQMAIIQPFGEQIIDNLVKRGVGGLTARQAEGIKAIWANPTHHEDRERNLWNLFNSVTQHITHSVENGERPRFELAERLSTAITAEFARAARNQDISELLVA
jgi:hypothetical protein